MQEALNQEEVKWQAKAIVDMAHKSKGLLVFLGLFLWPAMWWYIWGVGWGLVAFCIAFLVSLIALVNGLAFGFPVWLWTWWIVSGLNLIILVGAWYTIDQARKQLL